MVIMSIEGKLVFKVIVGYHHFCLLERNLNEKAVHLSINSFLKKEKDSSENIIVRLIKDFWPYHKENLFIIKFE